MGREWAQACACLWVLQIDQLASSMRRAKLRSTVELLGRKQLGPGSELPLTPADPASRILEALLNMPDQADRMEMLPAALQPPDPHSAPSEVGRLPHLLVQAHSTFTGDSRSSPSCAGHDTGTRLSTSDNVVEDEQGTELGCCTYI